MQSNIARTDGMAGSRREAEAIVAGRVGGYKTPLEYDNHARSRRQRQVNSSSDIAAGRLPRYAYVGPGKLSVG